MIHVNTSQVPIRASLIRVITDVDGVPTPELVEKCRARFETVRLRVPPTGQNVMAESISSHRGQRSVGCDQPIFTGRVLPGRSSKRLRRG